MHIQDNISYRIKYNTINIFFLPMGGTQSTTVFSSPESENAARIQYDLIIHSDTMDQGEFDIRIRILQRLGVTSDDIDNLLKARRDRIDALIENNLRVLADPEEILSEEELQVYILTLRKQHVLDSVIENALVAGRHDTNFLILQQQLQQQQQQKPTKKRVRPTLLSPEEAAAVATVTQQQQEQEELERLAAAEEAAVVDPVDLDDENDDEEEEEESDMDSEMEEYLAEADELAAQEQAQMNNGGKAATNSEHELALQQILGVYSKNYLKSEDRVPANEDYFTTVANVYTRGFREQIRRFVIYPLRRFARRTQTHIEENVVLFDEMNPPQLQRNAFEIIIPGSKPLPTLFTTVHRRMKTIIVQDLEFPKSSLDAVNAAWQAMLFGAKCLYENVSQLESDGNVASIIRAETIWLLLSQYQQLVQVLRNVLEDQCILSTIVASGGTL